MRQISRCLKNRTLRCLIFQETSMELFSLLISQSCEPVEVKENLPTSNIKYSSHSLGSKTLELWHTLMKQEREAKNDQAQPCHNNIFQM